MSPCLSWGYFLKIFGIRQRERACPAIAETPPIQRRREDSIPKEMPDQDLTPIQQQIPRINKYDVSLLHPDWRRFPHVPLYGWTNEHSQQLKNLNNMIVNGNLDSAYYSSETEYRAARFLDQVTILPRPNVSSVNEAVLLLRRSQGFHKNKSCCSEESLMEYDADDESDNNTLSRRYYNQQKSRRQYIEQQTAF